MDLVTSSDGHFSGCAIKSSLINFKLDGKAIMPYTSNKGDGDS